MIKLGLLGNNISKSEMPNLITKLGNEFGFDVKYELFDQASKTNFNLSEGITVDYVDPASMVYSYTEDPNFEDIYYVGEIKAITIPELKKEFPNISNEELERIQKMPGNRQYITGWGGYDENTVSLPEFGALRCP